MKYVIGIDPDADKHGVAVYRDGKLELLQAMDDVEIVTMVANIKNGTEAEITFAIEDVMANKFIYSRNQHRSKAAQSNIGMKVGQCQHAQKSLMRWLDHLGIKYQLFKPQRANWAENKIQFERLTGWDKRSSKDTRSAAFFGYLALAR